MEHEILNIIDKEESGALFYRADLHIHIFGSSPCVTDNQMTINNLIASAKEEDIKILSITDHNSTVNVQEAIQKGIAEGVFIIPGVELSTPSGHLLVYFKHLEELKQYMTSLSIRQETNGETRCNTEMFDCLEKLTTYPNSFALLSHIDSSKGLLENLDNINKPLVQDILKHQKLLGFEIKDKNSHVFFNEFDNDIRRKNIASERSTLLNIGKNQFLSRVMFSDAHSLENFGKNASGHKRITRIKLMDLSFESLRHAMIENDARIRIEEDIPESIPFVYGCKYVGGLLDDQIIKFSKNLNCIIGGRGTGKSTIFDTVRCLDKKYFKSERIDCDIWPDHIDYIWQDELKNKLYLGRSKYNALYNLAGKYDTNNFYLETFGQGDTAKITVDIDKDPSNLIEFLDGFIDFGLLKNEEIAKIDSLVANKAEIMGVYNLRQPLINVPIQLKEIKDKLKTVSDQNLKEIIQLEQSLEQEAKIKKELIEKLKIITQLSIPENIQTCLSELASLSSKEIVYGKDNLLDISKQIILIDGEVHSSFSNLLEQLKKYPEPINKQLQIWNTKEKDLRKLIAEKKEIAIKAGISDLKNISLLISQEVILKNKELQLNEYNSRLKTLKEKRENIIEELHKIRNLISSKRIEFSQNSARKLKNCLNDLEISLKYTSYAYAPAAEEIIKNAMSWRTTQVPKAHILISKLTLPTLINIIKTGNIPAISSIKLNDISLFTVSDAKEIIEKLKEEKYLFLLEEQVVSDLPKISIKKEITVSGKKEFMIKNFSQMSLGQQQSVLLSFVLSSDKNCPLIIDQPEDNLDGEFIYKSFIPTLRQAKEKRQIIIVTHNPNIAVLGDAEQIIPLRATSKKTIIMDRGSVDKLETNKMTCNILEGALEAFRKRALIYGFEIPPHKSS